MWCMVTAVFSPFSLHILLANEAVYSLITSFMLLELSIDIIVTVVFKMKNPPVWTQRRCRRRDNLASYFGIFWAV